MELSPRGKCAIKLDLLEVTVATIINIMNDLKLQWKASQTMGKVCLQSLVLWSFTIIFYGRNRFLHSARIEDKIYDIYRSQICHLSFVIYHY